MTYLNDKKKCRIFKQIIKQWSFKWQSINLDIFNTLLYMHTILFDHSDFYKSSYNSTSLISNTHIKTRIFITIIKSCTCIKSTICCPRAVVFAPGHKKKPTWGKSPEITVQSLQIH